MFWQCCAPEEPGTSEVVDSRSYLEKKGAPKTVDIEEPQQLPDTGAALKQKVTLRRTSASDPWGLSFEQVAASDILLITLVTEGAAEDFNKASAAGAYQFQKYDCIVGVDGEKAVAGMTRIFSSAATQVELSVARPSTVTETVKAESGETLGMTLKHTETGKTMTVQSITPTGTVKKTGANIREGDLVAAVNGEMGKGRDMLSIIGSRRGELTLTLLRIGA